MAQLAEIAFDMEQQALRRGVSYRDLPRGLSLCLVITGGHKVLSLARPAVMPSEEEISICRGLFHVPAEVVAEVLERTVTLRWPS